MAWHAIESVEPAVDKTINLLFRPFNLKLWLKLALVVFLMGSGGGGGSGNFGNVGDMGDGGDFDDMGGGDFDDFADFIIDNIVLIAVIIGILILIILVLWYISTVMYFVFLESVVKSKVEIVAGFKRYMSEGFRVFLFEIAITIIFLLLIAIPILLYYFIFGISFDWSFWAFLIFGIFALIVLIIIAAIISSFTIDFVVPYMYKGRGLIEGWKHLISVLRKNITQTILYVLIKIVLWIVSAILGFIIAIVVLLILAIPGIIIALLLIAIGAAVGISGLCSGTMLIVCIAIGILLFIVILLPVIYLITLATLPIPVFFRYYSLIFLTKIDKELDIVLASK